MKTFFIKYLAAAILVLTMNLFFISAVPGQSPYTAVANGNWNNDATWSGTGIPVAGNIVNISGNFTVTVTADAACATLNFPLVAVQTNILLINSGITLNVSGTITIPRTTGSGLNTITVGAGILNAGTIAFTSSGLTVRHSITVSTGTVQVTGNITVDAVNPSASIIFSGAGFLKTGGTLLYSGTSSTGTLTTVAGSTIEYNLAGDQATCKPVTYLGNLTLSGSGVKTFTTTPTIEGVLSIEGTATVVVTGAGVVTYGTAATLQYNTTTTRTTTAEEWLATFAASGGIIIANTGVITLGSGKIIGTGSKVTINPGATLDPGAFVSTFNNITSATLIINGTLDFSNAIGEFITGTVAGITTLTMGSSGLIKTIDVNGLGPVAGRSFSNLTATWNMSGISTNGTIEYLYTSAQTITDRDYNNLTISVSTGTKTWTVAGTRTINGNLTINTSVPLVLSGTPTVNVKGNWLNNGVFTAGTGTILLNGTATQTISGSSTTAFNNLTANNPVGVNISSGTSVNAAFIATNTGIINITGGTTTLGASATMTVNPLAVFKVTSPGVADFAGKPVTIKSDATGTGAIGTSTGSISTATAVTIERYISNKRAWRLLSAPISSGQTIKAAWMENSNNGNGFGTHITTFTGDPNAANFDAEKPASSIRTFANPGNTWTATPNTTSAINAKQGYMLFVRGNRAINLNDITAHSAATLRVTGTLKQGTQSAVTIPYSVTDLTLVGNPFASPVDYEYLYNNASPALSTSFYIWDANLAGTYGVGGFRLVTRLSAGTYQQTPAGGSAAANNSMRYIHSGQAFLANATSGGGTTSLVINEAGKATSVSNIFPFIPTTVDEEMTINMSSVETDLSVNLVDGIRAKYNIAYDAAVTSEDNHKLNNFNENLGILRDGESLIVERRPVIGTTDTTYFNISNMRQMNYQLDINTTSLNHTDLLGKIEDNFTTTSSPLNLDGFTIYSFTVTADPASSAADRFKVVFYTSGPLPVTFTSIKAVQQANNIAVEWKVENQTNIKQYEVEKSIDGRSFTKLATQIATGANGSAATYNWLDVNTVNGDNFYRVRSIGLSGGVQYTKIVKLRMGKGVPAITVYPNPVTDRVMTIQFTDMPAGNYTLSLVNPLGQIVQTRQITHTGANTVQTMSIERGVAGGNYQLQVIKPGGEKEVLKLLITE